MKIWKIWGHFPYFRIFFQKKKYPLISLYSIDKGRKERFLTLERVFGDMALFVSPPINELHLLRQPLTEGERLVFDLFHDHLPPGWEIYVQPHLNGLRPDFVLLHPSVGIAVFEVKDWDLDAMDYWVEKRPCKSPILRAKKDGKPFPIQSQNPVEKIHRYKQEIQELYCPRLNQRAGFVVITAGIIFPFAKGERVKALLSPCLDHRGMSQYPQYYPVSGMEPIRAGRLESVFPESVRRGSTYMSEELAKDMKNWLIEPDFSSSQRRPLELDRNQLSLVSTRTASGYRRIKGPAGTGKSLILAARAAELLGKGKKVLVVTYNITLLHYLMDLAVRWPASSGKTRKDITWLNFHYWCKRVCQESDHEEEYRTLWRDHFANHNSMESDLSSIDDDDVKDVLSNKLPNLVSSIIDEDEDGIIPRFDAVLVDERQDFLPSWWNVLRKVCREGGEMLLVADATQDIYGRAKSWTDEAMIGAGFRGGRWVELKSNYRLPPKALTFVRAFAERFLPMDMVDLPESAQGDLDIYPCILKWVQTRSDRALEVCKQELLAMAPNADPELLAIPDITFLCESQKFGRKLVAELGGKGLKAVHTFGQNKHDTRRRKIGFYMGDSRIKATTLYSFKGWESIALVKTDTKPHKVE
ncbi:MAG: UvrD/REP helicase [Syntrophus sp. PtaB.Bin001]|nr:MAG: UvrD/REP helicase [Syntrophus sp. PtaB.Bin001]